MLLAEKEEVMRRKRRFLCIFLAALMCMMQAMPVLGANNYNSFIKKTLAKKPGIAVTGKNLKSTGKNRYWGDWCKTKGVVSTLEADFNRDRKNELLVFYLEKGKRESGNRTLEKRILRMALYAKTGSSVKKVQDIKLDVNLDMYMGAWCNAFVYDYKNTKYIVFQNSQVAQGHKCTWYVLTVNKKNQFVVKTAVVDPGYTSGVGLYRLSSRLPASKIAEDTKYYKTGTVLYHTEQGMQNDSSYIRALKKELARYGLSISKKGQVLVTYSKPSKCYFMTADRSGRTSLFTIKATTRYANRVYTNTCKITDYTKVKNKL